MTRRGRYVIGSLIFVLLIVGSYLLLHGGVYGWTAFLYLPAVLGGLACWVFPQSTGNRAAGTGALAVIGCSLCLLLVRWEGIVCIVMAMPLVGTLGAIGGWLVYTAMRSKAEQRGAAMMLLLAPVSLTFDLKSPPTEYRVNSEITVAASPEQVWKHVVTFSELPEPTEMIFRTGLAYPKRARIVGSGPGAIRYCEFSTGPFVEPIVTWDEPRLLAFRVTENPAPLNEWSPFAEILAKHLHGYFISKHGQFELTRLPDGSTRLEGTTWYQHGLWPAEYWRWWSDAIIHRIHLRVLNHVRALAEADAALIVSPDHTGSVPASPQ
jgi:Polyketide cyclase / dehydrase and lipid transport